jgi:ribose 5-phosphate isomerase B
MKIYIGADHRGFELKQSLKQWLAEYNYENEDLGALEFDPNDDYPIYAQKVAEKVSGETENSRGIVICGSGVGVDIVANKFQGIRCGLGINMKQVAAARRDDDINILALAADEVNEQTAQDMVKIFLETEFENTERRTRRLDEIKKIEQKP